MTDDLTDCLTRLRADHGGDIRTGFMPTRLPAVKLFWSDHPIPRVPLVYDPGIAVIISGRKTGFLGDRSFVYDKGCYLAVGLPVCFDCETEATSEAPLIGLFLRSDRKVLHELASSLFETRGAAVSGPVTLGVEPLRLGGSMRDAVGRLARQLADDAEASLLAPTTVREIFFHALQDPHGRVLLAQTRPDRPEARIAALLQQIQTSQGKAPSIDKIAALSGMSAASFHRHFKAAFGTSPLQYLKQRRLMRAWNLLVDEKLSVTQTAQELGYASPAQFSRDFRSFFSVSPSQAGATGVAGFEKD
ncbi:MAG: AraC family transcriptional regulator [Pseudomonadota bacterium]